MSSRKTGRAAAPSSGNCSLAVTPRTRRPVVAPRNDSGSPTRRSVIAQQRFSQPGLAMPSITAEGLVYLRPRPPPPRGEFRERKRRALGTALLTGESRSSLQSKKPTSRVWCWEGAVRANPRCRGRRVRPARRATRRRSSVAARAAANSSRDECHREGADRATLDSPSAPSRRLQRHSRHEEGCTALCCSIPRNTASVGRHRERGTR